MAKSQAFPLAVMNIANFNDHLEEADFFIAEANGDITRVISEDLLSAPLFFAKDFPDERLISMENTDVLHLIETEPDILPFPKLRIFLEANVADRARDGTTGFSFWCEHRAGVVILLAVLHGQYVRNPVTVRIQTKGLAQLEAAVKLNGRWLPSTKFNSTMANQVQALFTSFCWFVREVSSPANFIASVSPDKRGKSVEWLRSRTHYVLIHRQHPANTKEVSHGSQVSEGPGYLKRQAHTRRAHARVLRSPRFKNKIGQTIRVKSAWVGPAEWKQNNSIYRLVRAIR